MKKEKIIKIAKITSVNLAIYFTSLILFAKFVSFFLLGLNIDGCGIFCKMNFMLGLVIFYPAIILLVLGALFYKNKMSIFFNILVFFIGSWNGLIISMILMAMSGA